MYPQSMFFSKNMKNIEQFHLKMNIFTAVKYCCILHGRVCVMHIIILLFAYTESRFSHDVKNYIQIWNRS